MLMVATVRRLLCVLGAALFCLASGPAGLTAGPAGAASATSTTSAGPKVGDHWHMAFGVWNCGKWEPAAPPGDDPLGIHTHGDGVIHIHPFVTTAAGANAVLGKFLEVEKMSVSSTELKLGTKSLQVGALCDGKKATLRTMLWEARSTKTPKTVSGDPNKVSLRDQATVVFAFGPADAKVGLPPSFAEMEDPADLPPPPLGADALTTLPTPPRTIPTVVLKGTPPSVLKVSDRSIGSGVELKKNGRPYVRFVLYLWRTGEVLDKSSWLFGDQPTALQRVGKGRLLPALDKGLVGMKVGGIREIAIPPNEGFGTQGSPPVLGTDTMVMVVQLVAVAK